MPQHPIAHINAFVTHPKIRAQPLKHLPPTRKPRTMNLPAHIHRSLHRRSRLPKIKLPLQRQTRPLIIKHHLPQRRRPRQHLRRRSQIRIRRHPKIHHLFPPSPSSPRIQVPQVIHQRQPVHRHLSVDQTRLHRQFPALIPLILELPRLQRHLHLERLHRIRRSPHVHR